MTEQQFRVRKDFRTSTQKFRRGTKGISLSSFAGQPLTAQDWVEKGFLAPISENLLKIVFPIDFAARRQHLEKLRVQYETGRSAKPLFDTIAYCCRENCKLPIWAQSAFLEKYNDRTASLDKAFGRLLPKHKKSTWNANFTDQIDEVVPSMIYALTTHGHVVEIEKVKKLFPTVRIDTRQKTHQLIGARTIDEAKEMVCKITGLGQDVVRDAWTKDRKYKAYRREWNADQKK